MFKTILGNRFMEEADRQRCHRDEHFQGSYVYGAKCEADPGEENEPSIEAVTQTPQYGKCGEGDQL